MTIYIISQPGFFFLCSTFVWLPLTSSIWKLKNIFTPQSKCEFSPTFSRVFFRPSKLSFLFFIVRDHNATNLRSFGGWCWKSLSKSFHSKSMSPSKLAILRHSSGWSCAANRLICSGDERWSSSDFPSPIIVLEHSVFQDKKI